VGYHMRFLRIRYGFSLCGVSISRPRRHTDAVLHLIDFALGGVEHLLLVFRVERAVIVDHHSDHHDEERDEV